MVSDFFSKRHQIILCHPNGCYRKTNLLFYIGLFTKMKKVPGEPHYFSQIDVIHSLPRPVELHREPMDELCVLMREMVVAQDRHNELMEELLQSLNRNSSNKALQLALWKKSNPELAEFCRRAADKLDRVQTDLLSTITEEVEYNSDVLLDSEFGLSEFVDRFGTKFMHLNALLQVLSQLGNAPDLQLRTPENAPAERRKDA